MPIPPTPSRPFSVLFDLVKLSLVARPKAFGFLVFVELILAGVKLVATYFAYTLKRGQEAAGLGGDPYQPYEPTASVDAPARPFAPASVP